MSKIEYTEHKCDICGNSFRVKHGEKTTQSLKTIDMPAKSYDCEGRNYSRRQCTVDMCDKCYNEFWEFVQRKYEVCNTISGIVVNVNENT